MKTNRLTRLLAATLAAALLLTLAPLPYPGSEALAVGNYGRTTDTGVRIRKSASTDADYWFRVDEGWVMSWSATVEAGGVKWYKVTTTKPATDGARTYVGYVHSDYFEELTEEEAAAWEANPVQTAVGVNSGNATPAPADDDDTKPAATVPSSSVTGATGSISAGGVNFRSLNGDANIQKHASMMKLDRGVVVELLEIPSIIDENHWYKVRYDGLTGYIQAPYIKVISTGSLTTSVPGTTPAPESSPASPNAKYVKLILSSANLRATPGGKVMAQWETTGGTLPVDGSTVKSGGYTWYPVIFNKTTYYVRGDCVQVVTSPAATPTPTAAPETTDVPAATSPAPSANAQYVKLILSSANLRAAPGGKVMEQWETTGGILPVNGSTVKSDGYTWYPVIFNKKTYYVRGDCVQAVSDPAATPVPDPGSGKTDGYVKTTAGGVNLRIKPADEVIDQIDRGTVCRVVGPTTVLNGVTWYYVYVNGSYGYLHGDFVTACSAGGSDVTTPAPTGPGSPAPSSYGYIQLTSDKVNLRKVPAGESIVQLAKNTILPMTASAVKSGVYTWYPVRTSDGKNGYIRGDCAKVVSSEGGDVDVTPAPTSPYTVVGYVKSTSSVNIRSSAAGNLLGEVAKGTILSVIGSTEAKNGVTWYPVDYNGAKAYVHGGFLTVCDKNGNPVSNPDIPAAGKYIQTNVDKVNLRASASKDSEAKFNVPLGTVMAFDTVKNVGGSAWYQAIYKDTQIWVLGSCVKEMTEDEYKAWAAANPSATVQTEIIAGYVKTIAAGVNLRSTAGGTNIICQIAKGTVLSYAKTEPKGGTTWYYVKSASGWGWLSGSYVETCNSDGSSIDTPDVPTPTDGPYKPATAGQEASYSTLKLGSSGTAVKSMVQELINQGYYTGAVTSSYTTTVQEAVKNFQKAKGLTVDGIAGPNTLHALFQTVPVGQSDISDLTMAIYKAEKIDWYTGGINELWARGANYKVYDVKTGIVWWAHRWAGGSHVDAEPLTAADTARLCKIYGVSKASDIASKNLYQRRPCLVTIGSRTFACSLYGVPHNYPEGDTISTNEFRGQVCIHFTNSKTHTSNKVDSGHKEAIEYAWLNAPNGHK